MNICGIIPARGGSKGVPKKNIQLLSGKSLIAYTILAAKRSRLINRLVVSTDSEEISLICFQYDIEVIQRPPELATDDAPIEESLRHAVIYLKQTEGYHTDIVVQMQANVPIRKEGIIDKVIRKLIHSNADSVVSIYEVTQRPETSKILKGDKLLPRYKFTKGYRRQDFQKLYLLDGAVLATRTEILLKTIGDKRAHAYLGSDVRGVIQESYYSIEVDSPKDFVLAEAILNVLTKNRNKLALQ